jgi:hypothetical protein
MFPEAFRRKIFVAEGQEALLHRVAGIDFLAPGREITITAPNRNYELKKNHNYLLNCLLFG